MFAAKKSKLDLHAQYERLYRIRQANPQSDYLSQAIEHSNIAYQKQKRKIVNYELDVLRRALKHKCGLPEAINQANLNLRDILAGEPRQSTKPSYKDDIRYIPILPWAP